MGGMNLPKRFDQLLWALLGFFLVVVFSFTVNVILNHDTFADSGSIDQSALPGESKFVIFYDDTEKLIVRTEADTVREAISRANITLNVGDVVEPALDTQINSSRFYINIHRARPVIVKDGKNTKYLMTASTDTKTIASDAGLELFDGDEVKFQKNDTFLEVGVVNVYEIIRNGGRDLTIEEEIPFGERTIKSYDLEPGATEIRELGEVGVKKTVYKVLYQNNEEVSRELISETVEKEPKDRVVAVGATWIEKNPLTPSRGAQVYSYTKSDGTTVDRKETYYDLDMSRVMHNCGGGGYYTVRDDGVKVDKDGYVIVAAHLGNYPRCSVVETSLGQGKVYDTGGFAENNSEQFDLATDWTNRNGI